MIVGRYLPVLALFVSIHVFGQNNTVTPGNLSPIFDISPDNKNLAVCIANGPVYNL